MAQNNFFILLFLISLSNLALADTLLIQAEVHPHEITDINAENNSSLTSVNIVDKDGLNLIFRPIDWESLDLNFSLAVKENSDFFKATYPINQDKINVELNSLPYIPLPLERVPVIGIITTLSNLELQQYLINPNFDFVVGVAPKDWFSLHLLPNAVGAEFPTIKKAIIITPDNYPVTAHEIGHKFDFCDEYEQRALSCPNQHLRINDSYGFWVEKNTEIFGAECFMDSAGGGPYWINDSDYNYLLSKIPNNQSFVQLSSEESTPKMIIGSANIEKNGSVQLNNFYVVNGNANNSVQPGNFSLKLMSENNNILSTMPFDVSFTLLTDPPIDVNTSGFVFAVPFVSGTKRIVIEKDGVEKAERVVSKNAPVVSFISPASGETISGVKTIKWSATDKDKDALSFVLQYSSDNGASWNPLAIGIDANQFDFNFSMLFPGNNYKMKVIATDGVLTRESVSKAFSVISHGPVLQCPTGPIDENYLFAWSSQDFNKTVKLQLSYRSDFKKKTSVTVTKLNPAPIRKQFKALTGYETKAAGKVLFARLYALDKKGKKAYSGVCSFALVQPIQPALDCPSLPVDGNFAFVWNPGDFSSKVRLWLSYKPDFKKRTSVVATRVNPTPIRVQYKTLIGYEKKNADGNLFAKLYAVDKYGRVAYTQPCKFTLKQPVQPTLDCPFAPVDENYAFSWNAGDFTAKVRLWLSYSADFKKRTSIDAIKTNPAPIKKYYQTLVDYSKKNIDGNLFAELFVTDKYSRIAFSQVCEFKLK